MKIEVVQQYFGLLEQFNDRTSDYEGILHPEMEQTEYPNWLTDHVAVSNYEVLFSRMGGGAKLLSSQNYEIRHVHETADAIITEVTWTAEVALDAGVFTKGQELKAYFCCVFEFKDGLIYRQRNYDCFERF
ncbi:nuclear transport factor 2 family protein [Paenibacillus sp. sgz500958]|uniref:nuclear transport factor 2 family protein n=1 Tax=Paenibacillus sp. sgz500958 TaxID=3242475 RepID=UPI0036D36D95